VELSKEVAVRAIPRGAEARTRRRSFNPIRSAALEDLRAMGQLNQQNASAIGVSSDQFKQYTEQVRIAELTTKSLTEATLAQSAALEKIAASTKQTITQQTGTKTEIETARHPDGRGRREGVSAAENRRV
jgi:uncharacterized sporulation protein YeaH/YhbH (DUF444 family)